MNKDKIIKILKKQLNYREKIFLSVLKTKDKKIKNLEERIKVYKGVVKENLKCIGELKIYNANKGKLIDKLKQNDFEIIASGEVILTMVGDYVGGREIQKLIEDYKSKNIQIGIKIID